MQITADFKNKKSEIKFGIKIIKFILFLLTGAAPELYTYGQNPNYSLSYTEVIGKYRSLDSLYKAARLIPYGRSDNGELIYLFIISNSEIFSPTNLHELNKCILFINNGIHANEPDGIDASFRLAENLLANSKYSALLENTVVCIVPVFNVDGALQRSCCSRVNQDGPEEYGIRANSKNLDLNRDFMKTDAVSTISLINIIRGWDPDVFVDTHVSDGADYQYRISMISTPHDKMSVPAGTFLKQTFTPGIFRKMKEKKDEMTPYVFPANGNEIPDSGIAGFPETPRYLTGYVSLFNSFSFISESHMLKPFPVRVDATYNLLMSILEVCKEHGKKIIEIRKEAALSFQAQKYFQFNWKCDYSKSEYIDFNGYEVEYKPSNVTGENRLIYNHDKKYKKKIPFYDHYYARDSVLIPKYFYLPHAYADILRMLEMNGVHFERLDRDSLARVSAKYFSEYKTVDEPYEGHYLHSNVKTYTQERIIKFSKGDYVIPLPQKNMRYVLEALIPEAEDSYFCWGFFDSFLQQKEFFSDYVFEDVAAEIIKNDSALRNDFEKWKINNPASTAKDKLNYIYRHSDYFEKNYKRYPVFLVY